jgi:hypothetical protein
MLMRVTAADGREIEAHFGPDVTSPQTDVDAPPDLRDAMIRAWRRKVGRPSGITNIESDDVVHDALRATARAERRLTAANVAANGGTFTYSNLRSYLRVTGRTWQEFRDSFLAAERLRRGDHRPRGTGSKGPGKP